MRFGGILLAVVLSLSACTGDPEPKEPDPTPTKPSTGDVPTPSIALPTEPPQVGESGPEGAVALVSYWVRVRNYAAQTGDVRRLDELSGPGCEQCDYFVELFRVTYSKGGYYRGGAWSVSNLEVTTAAGSANVFALVKSGRGLRSSGPDAEEVVDPPVTNDLVFTVGEVDGRPQVTSIGRTKS